MLCTFLVFFLFVSNSWASEEDGEIRGRMEKVKAGLCAGPQSANTIDKFFDCDFFAGLVVSEPHFILPIELQGSSIHNREEKSSISATWMQWESNH